MPKGVAEVLFGWNNWFGKHGSSLVWNMVCLCLTWIIWRERNNCTFNGVEDLVFELKLVFLGVYFSGLAFWV